MLGACKGPLGCSVQGDVVKCDDSLAEEGDPCALDDQLACAVDAKVLLKCEKRRFVVSTRCSGNRTCKVKDDLVDCR